MLAKPSSTQLFQGKPYSFFPAIGSAIILLSITIFGALAVGVCRGDLLALYDPVIGKWLLNHGDPAGRAIFYAITLLGSTIIVETSVVVIGLWLAWRKNWLQMVTLLASVGGGTLLNGILKSVFTRPRPDFMAAFYQETSYGFPSGHAMTAVLFYGTVAYLTAPSFKNRKRRSVLYTASALLALLIGLSRLYLGVHYLTDVLGGWVAGIAWLFTCILIAESLKAPE